MEMEPSSQSPVVRLTRWECQGVSKGRGRQQRLETTRWVVYGVDAQGAERVYADHRTEEEHNAWCETDPLWKEAQRAMIGKLLDNPKTRDLVLQINIKGALDKGDTETAVALAKHLSPEAWQRLMADSNESPGQGP